MPRLARVVVLVCLTTPLSEGSRLREFLFFDDYYRSSYWSDIRAPTSQSAWVLRIGGRVLGGSLGHRGPLSRRKRPPYLMGVGPDSGDGDDHAFDVKSAE